MTTRAPDPVLDPSRSGSSATGEPPTTTITVGVASKWSARRPDVVSRVFDWAQAGLGAAADGLMTRARVIPLILLMVLAAGVGDFVTGLDLAFTLFYAIPIGLATWVRGRRFGFLVAALSIGLAAGVDVSLRFRAGMLVLPSRLIWNQAGSLILFVLGVEILDRLHVYVEEEKRERRLAVDQLRHAERLNVVGKLAAGVAHELGTPINVIMGMAEMLSENATTPEAHKRLRTIREQSQKMTTIIRKLLDFSRKAGADKTRVDLCQLTREVAALLEPTARQQASHIVLELASAPVEVLANRMEFGQVLSNLVLNGIQAMPNGGTVRVRCDLRRDEQLETAVLSVSDEGSGVRAADLPFIFDPFFTTKPVGVGTGLGLSVSYAIVQDHGGHIKVMSRVGQGSTFMVIMPAAKSL
jgi:signal transduction histidine kinase